MCCFARAKLYSHNRYGATIGYKELQGLQIENKFYYKEGEKVRSKSINSKGGKNDCPITETYEIIPKWAPPELIALQEKFLKSKSNKAEIAPKTESDELPD